MRIRNASARRETVKLQMSSMIDIVFLLLVFFVMTFKITAVEGDLALQSNAPKTHPSADVPPERLTVYVRLEASGDGRLSGIGLHDRDLRGFDELQEQIVKLTAGRGTGASDTVDVVMHCDQRLQYEHVVDAITAVSGFVGTGGEIVRLPTSVRFSSSDRP